MPKFSIRIESDDAWKLNQTLTGAGIPVVGPASAGFPASPGGWSTSDHVTAIVEAETAEAAVERVREVIGPEANVGSAEPYGD